jgi:hypothetical protein
MINVNMQIDPLIYAALERLASQDTREPAPGRWHRATRASVMRDAIYTAVWNAHHGGPELKRAPICPPLYHGQFFRVLEGKIVTIDENGLQKL